MDIQRPDLAEKRKKKRIRNGLIAAGAVLLVTLGLSRLKPAAPRVERATRLDRHRQARPDAAPGARPRARWCPRRSAGSPRQTNGRVERIVAAAGHRGEGRHGDPRAEQPRARAAALDAESQLRAAEAPYAELKVRLESQRLDQQAAAARVQAEYQAGAAARRRRRRAGRARASSPTSPASSPQVTADELANRNRIEQKRLAIAARGDRTPSSPCSRRRSSSARAHGAPAPQPGRRAQGARPASTACCSRSPVEVGPAGDARARTWPAWPQPTQLKAVIRDRRRRRPRTCRSARPATVDTRNGVVAGQGGARRSRRAERHGHRRRRARRARCPGRAARPDRRRHHRARAPRRRPLRGPPGAGPGRGHGAAFPARPGRRRAPAA